MRAHNDITIRGKKNLLGDDKQNQGMNVEKAMKCVKQESNVEALERGSV